MGAKGRCLRGAFRGREGVTLGELPEDEACPVCSSESRRAVTAGTSPRRRSVPTSPCKSVPAPVPSQGRSEARAICVTGVRTQQPQCCGR